MKIILALSLIIMLVLPAMAGEVALEGVAYRLVRGAATNSIGVYVEKVLIDLYSILEEKHLADEDIRALHKYLVRVESTEPSDNYCAHDPGFAVSIFKQNDLIYDASYCFKCDSIGKGTEAGWIRLAMKGSDREKEALKEFISSWFSK